MCVRGLQFKPSYDHWNLRFIVNLECDTIEFTNLKYLKTTINTKSLIANVFFILVSLLTFQIFLLTSNSLKIHTLHLYDRLTIKCLCLGYKSFTDDDIIAGSFKRCSSVKSVYIKEKRDSRHLHVQS